MFELHPQLAADTVALGDFKLCTALLMNDSQYPWVILVPRRAAIREIFALLPADQTQLALESAEVARAMMAEFEGEKFNQAALGNLVSQLHIHHIVRFEVDAAWPQPVWGAAPRVEYSEHQLKIVSDRLRQAFSNLNIEFKLC